MRKRIYLCFILIGLGLILGRCALRNSGKIPDYKIYQSIISGSDNYKNVDLKVIVYVKDFDVDKMLEKIRKQYVELNGEPDRLQIKLFGSLRAFEKAQCCGSKVFEKISYNF